MGGHLEEADGMHPEAVGVARVQLGKQLGPRAHEPDRAAQPCVVEGRRPQVHLAAHLR